MAENRVTIEGMWSGDTYPGATTNPLPVLISGNPQVDGTYIYSIANVLGTALAQTLMTLFNPIGSGKNLIIGGAFVSTEAAAGTTATVPLRLHRLSAAPTGGTLGLLAEVFKLDTANPNPVGVIRYNNPSVVLGPAAANSPPPVTTGVSGGQFVHEIDLPSPAFVVLRPGEGIAAHVASGDTAQRWNLTFVWAEV